jgi:polar amino acid transport system substrate-binding protein
MKKIISVLLVLMMSVSMFAACGGGAEPEAEDTSLTSIQEKGVLILGLDDAFPPMGFRDDNEEIIGFDIDVAKAVCEILGVELQMQPIDWATKEVELNAGNIDCIWNGMSWTQERSESMSLSMSYLPNSLALVVMNDSGINGIADMAGKTVAVQSGSSAEDVLAGEDGAELTGMVKEIVTFGDYLVALLDLESGASDAVLIDSIMANYLIAQNGKQMKVLEDYLYEETFAIGFRKADVALTDAVNAALSQLKADGTLGAIATEWFGSDLTIVE